MQSVPDDANVVVPWKVVAACDSLKENLSSVCESGTLLIIS